MTVYREVVVGREAGLEVGMPSEEAERTAKEV
jgi:hypothetical protein